MTTIALTSAQSAHPDFRGAHSIGMVATFGDYITPAGAYSDDFIVGNAMTGRNRAPLSGYVGKHRRVDLSKPVNMAKRTPVQRVDLRKRYVNAAGKINLYKVVLSKGVKG